MRSVRFALAGLLALAACGDNIKAGGGTPDATPDGPGPGDGTFTSFVIDLIQNQTADNTEPVPFATFATLPDPALDDPTPSAYAPLFQ
ncbi:MAG: hypothetical protein M3680_20340 [Myxococcota bacterium]|nr:hypothetical protein [Myxococcota bacterium]